MTAAAAIAEVLRDFGMWLTSHATREKRAVALAKDGATADGIEHVCTYVEQAAAHDLEATGKRLNHILAPGRWQDALMAAEAAQERAARPDDAKAEPGAADREANVSRQSHDPDWGRQRQAGLAWAMVSYDRKSPQQVREELQIGEAGFAELLREGAEIYSVGEPEAAVDAALARHS